jgi:hypothetical protein
MTYNASIPPATEYLSDSQPQILENFSQLNTLFAINHVTFDAVAASDRGKHTFISFVEQAADPSTAANELALYTKDLSGSPAVYLRKESDGDVILLYSPGAGSVTESASTTAAGVLIYGNGLTVTSPSTGIYSYTFDTAKANTNYVILPSVNSGNRMIGYQSKATTGFTIAITNAAAAPLANIHDVAVIT